MEIVSHPGAAYDPGLTLPSREEQSQILSALLITFLLFLINSYQSIVGYSADQHFQILEFASFKRGNLPLSELAWEYHYQERQALQPWIAYGILVFLDSIGLTDPVRQIVAIRVLMSGFMLFCLSVFVRNTVRRYFLPEYRSVYIWSSFVFWVIPVYYVHFASETFSQGLMLLGTALLLNHQEKPGRLTGAGFLYALAFYARFQSAITIGILLLLFLVRERRGWNMIAPLLTGGVAGLAVGVYADWWLYGELVFTPQRYLEFQLFKGVVNEFGTSPFYDYLIWIFGMSTPLLGVLIYFGFLGNIYTKKAWFLFIPVVVTVLLFSLVGHKEERFMFQILAFFPFVVSFGLQALVENFNISFSKQWRKVLLVSVGLVNFLLLLKGTMINNGWASIDARGLTPFIAREYKEDKVRLYFRDPRDHPCGYLSYSPEKLENGTHWSDKFLYPRFYLPKEFTDKQIDSFLEQELIDEDSSETKLISVRKKLVLDERTSDVLEKKGYRLVHASIPLWLDRHLPVEGYWGQKLSGRIFYLFEKKTSASKGQAGS